MNLALLFPGQGAETPGMGIALARQSTGARELLELAGNLTGVDLFRLLERGGRDLARTEVLQPALTAVSLGAYLELKTAGVSPALVAGHSLGEIPALVAAGYFGPREAVALAAKRGKLMAKEAARHPGGMVALRCRARSDVERLLASARGSLDLAAHNAPDEWVVAGNLEDLAVAIRTHGGRKLRVAGPWHGRAMRGALEAFREAVRAACRSWPERMGRPGPSPAGGETPKQAFLAAAPLWVCNRTGKIAGDPAAVPDLLAEQLIHPVQWVRTMTTLRDAGVADVITVGPGRTLRALVHRNAATRIRVLTTEDLEDLALTLEAVSS